MGIYVRVVDGVAHAGLGSQVADNLGLEAADDSSDGLGVADVQFVGGEAGAGNQLGMPGALERDGVVGVEVVHSVDLVPLRQQPLAEVHADEPGRSGY